MNKKFLKITRERRFVGIFLIGIVLMSVFPLVSGFGFSFSYGGDKPVIVYPGQTLDVPLRIVTSTLDANNGNMNLKLELVDGAGIAKIDSNKEYAVSPGKDGVAQITLSIPKNAPIDKDYMITLRVAESNPASSEGGMVSFTTSTSMSFKVLVQEKPEEPKGQGNIIWIGLVVILVIVIAVVVSFILKDRKSSKKPLRK